MTNEIDLSRVLSGVRIGLVVLFAVALRIAL